jgi:hypothetical protein
MYPARRNKGIGYMLPTVVFPVIPSLSAIRARAAISIAPGANVEPFLVTI